MAYFIDFPSLSDAREYLSLAKGVTGACTATEDGVIYRLCRVAAGLLTLDTASGKLSFEIEERIPLAILAEAVSFFQKKLPFEAAGRIYRRRYGGWFFHPLESLEVSRVHVRYSDRDEPAEAKEGKAVMVAEIHSHNTMPAFFSSQDFVSAVYPGLYLCVGNLDRAPVSVACCAQMDFVQTRLAPADVFRR